MKSNKQNNETSDFITPLLPYLEYAVQLDAPVSIMLKSNRYDGNVEKINISDGWLLLTDTNNIIYLALTQIDVLSFKRSISIKTLKKISRQSCKSKKPIILPYTEILKTLIDQAIQLQIVGDLYNGILRVYDSNHGILILEDILGPHILEQQFLESVLIDNYKK